MASSSDNVPDFEEIFQEFEKVICKNPNRKALEIIKNLGNKNLVDFLNSVQNDVVGWKIPSLRIAVTGSSGQGKSTLINTMRGLKPKDHGAAAIDVVECTKEVEEYPDPKNPNLLYCDLPGVGTSNFPRDQYFERIRDVTKDKVEFGEYDFFLIVSASRFTEEDAWLAKQVAAAGRQYYFIRTKIDQDLENSHEDDEDGYDEAKILEKIRNNCLQQLEKTQSAGPSFEIMKECKIFLISGKFKNYGKWDFPKLVNSLLNDYPKLKRAALIMSINANCKEIIRKKAQILRDGIWGTALLSAFYGAALGLFSLPGVLDTSAMNPAYRKYKSALGLDKKSLEIAAQTFGTSIEEVREHMKNTPYISHIFGEFNPGREVLINAAANYTTDGKSDPDTKTSIWSVLLALGLIVGSIGNYYSVQMELNATLSELENAAIAVMDFLSSSAKKDDGIKMITTI